MLKKTMSILLSIIMIISSIPFAFTANAATVSAANVESAITQFENKMATISPSNVLTNIAPAYEAYVELCDVYDTYQNIDSSVDMSSAYNKLVTATAQIGTWKRQSINNKTTCNSDTNWPAQNCLVTTMNNAKRNTNGHEFFNSDCTVYWEDGLYYYDGTNPYMPVELRGSIRYSSWAVTFLNCYIKEQYDNGSLHFAGWDKSGSARWAGNNGGNKYTFADVTANVKNDAGWSVGGTPNQTSGFYIASNSTSHFANFFTIDGQADFDNAESPTYSKRYIPYSFNTNMTSPQGQSGTIYSVDIVVGSDNDKGFYILNYKAILDAIAKTKAYDYLKNVKNYKLGRLSDVCESLDAATSFDLSAYNLSNVKQGAEAIKYASEGLTTSFNTPIPDTAESSGSIEEIMASFEAKLKENKYFSNYLASYKAYVECKMAYDTATYGGRTDIDLNKYAYKLYKEMRKMHEVSTEIETVQPLFSEGDSSNPINSHNCVWTERNTDPTKGTSGGFDNYWMGIYWQNGVYLYDGTNPKIPIMCLIQPNSSIGNYKNVYVWSISLEAGGTLKLADDWHYIIGTDRIFSNVISSPKTTPSLKSTYGVTDLITSGKRAYFANYMTVDSKTEFANGNYYQKLDPRTITVLSSLRDAGGNKEPDGFSDFTAQNDDNFIYIINYEPLKTILDKPDIKNYLANVENYSEGGMSTLLSILNDAMETAESFSTTDFSDTSRIYEVANTIRDVVPKFTKYNPTANVSQFQDLRNAIDLARSTYEAGKGEYDDELWKEFTDAYEKGQSYFANVIDTGKYPTTKTAMGQQATTIMNAYKALTITLSDFASIKEAYNNLIEKLGNATYFANDVKEIASLIENLDYLDVALSTEEFVEPSSKALVAEIARQAKAISDATANLNPAGELSTEVLDASIETLKAYALDPDEYSGVSEALKLLNNVDKEETAYVNGNAFTCAKYNQEEFDYYIREALETVQKQKYALYINGELEKEYTYGDEVNIELESNADIYYAYVSNSSSNVKIDENRKPLKGEIGKYYTSDSKIKFIIKGDTYLTTKDVSANINNFKVTFVCNIKSTILGVDYVENKVVLPAPNSFPFYEFVGYSVNGQGNYQKNDEIEITANTVITANYKKAENAETYTIFVINEDGRFSEREITAEYNERIELTNDDGDAVVWTTISLDDLEAWYDIYDNPEDAQGIERVVAYGPTYSFYAHEDAVIICYNQDAWEEELSLGAIAELADENGVAAYTSSSDQVLQLATKFSIISSYVMPNDCTFVEAGLLFSKNQATDMKLEDVGKTEGMFRFKSTQQTVGNQFTISITNPKSNVDYSYMAYVVYKDKDGKNHTAYSSLEQGSYEVQ